MFKYIVAVVVMVTGSYALEITNVTGTTPPPVPCEDFMCNGNDDGNYVYKHPEDDQVNEHYFLQCSNGKAYCQPCWPLSLVFKQECNQCMYNQEDPCYTTKEWHPTPSFECPDLCPSKGVDFKGNIADPNQKKHYVGCWQGVTMGCVRCPEPLLYNEPWNACLYDGKHNTLPKDS